MRTAFGFACLLACLVLALGQARACTLWAGAGERAGGGTLLAKNRDNPPDQTDSLVLTAPEKGLPFLGLYATQQGKTRLVAGINKAGLALVSATAGSVPKALRKTPSNPRNLAAKVLAELSGVDQALAHTDWFAGHSPVIYMLADARKIAWIEIGPGGKVAWRVADRDTLTHTNHYLSPELAGENRVPGESSQARLARIEALLAQAPTPLTLETFAAMSRDRQGGPDNAVFRTGSTPQKTRTLATFLVRLETGRPPRALVSVFDSDRQPWTLDLTLDEKFWSQARAGQGVRIGGE